MFFTGRSRSGFSGTRPSTKQAIAVIAARVAASQAALAERVKAEKAAEEAEFEALFPQVQLLDCYHALYVLFFLSYFYFLVEKLI